MEKAVEKIIEGCVELGFKLIGLILILLIGFKVIKILLKLIKKSKGFNKLEKSVQTFIISFLGILLKALVVITALAYIGIPMTSMLTVFGTATLAFGLALQGGLTNMMGGLMLLIFKPFKVGEFIETHSDSGIVEEITIFYTILKTGDNKKIVIPNGPLSNETIINYSAREKRRLDLNFSVSYDSDIDKVKKILLDTLNEEELVLKDEEIFARLSSHGDSALVFTTRVWVKTEDYWAANFNLQENIKKALDRNKIEIPYPQLDVNLKK
ncbi:MAG: mechanosensitive ion channel [Rickettsiales bacterium]|nr:mechanosensitive ion channel [Rickettsiales bacterium]